MEYKDIISLVISIFFEGILLFCFQKAISTKFDKINFKNQIKERVFTEYFKIIKELYDYVYIVMETDYFLEPISKESGVYIESDLAEHMRHVTLYCKKLHVHFNTYKKMLGVEKELTEKHEKLMEVLETYECSNDFYDIYNRICPMIKEMHEIVVEKCFK